MTIFTPGSEPYLGVRGVHALDTLIPPFMNQQILIAEWTQRNAISPIQEMASQLVPGASAIALGTRELVRQGYLLPAQILTRPMLERVATLSYLVENPEKLPIWTRGWTHNERPSLRDRMKAMHLPREIPLPGDEVLPGSEFTRFLFDNYNSLIHGDPRAALASAILRQDGTAAYTVGRDLGSPTRADRVCTETACRLAVLLARCSRRHKRTTLALRACPPSCRVLRTSWPVKGWA